MGCSYVGIHRAGGPLPFIDELIGKWQFERLCQENSTIYIAPDAKGRTVYLASGTPEEAVKGTWGAYLDKAMAAC